MNNDNAISAFLALGQETRLNVFRLIVQRGDLGLTPSQITEFSTKLEIIERTPDKSWF